MKVAALIVVSLALLLAVEGLNNLSKDKDTRIPNALAVVIAACLTTLVLIINS
jgi:hypothetical protein